MRKICRRPMAIENYRSATDRFGASLLDVSVLRKTPGKIPIFSPKIRAPRDSNLRGPQTG